MKRNIVLSILALLVLCSFKNCGENEKFPEYVDMIFMIPITISPVQENFRTNDTITIEAIFSDTIKEFYSGMSFRVQDFDFLAKIVTVSIESPDLYLSQQPGNSSSYDIISDSGSTIIAGSLGGFFGFNYLGNTYSNRTWFIPKVPGLYNIAFLSSYVSNHKLLDDIIDLGYTQNGQRRIPVLRNIYFIVNDGDNNFQLLNENCKLALTDFPVPNNIYGERYGTFTFRVVE